jgi:GT2 family glycosyltransferase
LTEATAYAVLEKPVGGEAKGDATKSGTARPAVSIVVVTFDNLVFNRLCLESLLANTAGPEWELLVVDNGSTDGTVEYLQELATGDARVRLIFNGENRGFAAANNQALAAASGEILVLLNNDTIVPPGWLEKLIRPLSDQSVGLVGPVTNRAGNEADITTDYRTYGELIEFAAQYASTHAQETRELDRLILFCAALRRDVYVAVGPLDEQFQQGMFEDDDFSCRLRAAGFRLLLVEEAFVHHFGQASLGKLAATGEYGPLFQANRKRWEEKWGRDWVPYTRRENREYDESVERLWELAAEYVKPDEIALIVSKGDERLVNWPGWQGWHFPQNAAGEYAGFHPANSGDAIAQIEALQAQGAKWFVLPAAASWWWNHYGELRNYLRFEHEWVAESDTAGRLFYLLRRPENSPATDPAKKAR